jgi:hypothetical protein
MFQWLKHMASFMPTSGIELFGLNKRRVDVSMYCPHRLTPIWSLKAIRNVIAGSEYIVVCTACVHT